MKTPLQVLIVDDNRSAADALARYLRRQGDEIQVAYGGEDAIALLDRTAFDLVLTDLKMEPVDGLSVLRAARNQRPPVEVIVFTAFGAVDVAVKAMRLGARDFLTKPVTVDQIAQRVEQVRTERSSSSESVPADFVFVAESPLTRALLAHLKRAAAAPTPIWLTGEVGSGRGYVARALHRFGLNPNAPFSVRDLGREAPWPTEGTVVLPNVDDLPDDLQRILHRSLSSVPDGVRLVSTANVDGKRLVEEGKLRPELYYSLAVITATVPPLRVRSEDILPLLDVALEHFCSRYGCPKPALDTAQAARLQQHSWPGNVRELWNLAERAAVMGPEVFDIGESTSESPIPGMPQLEPGFDLTLYLESVEKSVLIEALRKCGGDRNLAGRILSVERNTLRYKLNKYGLLS